MIALTSDINDNGLTSASYAVLSIFFTFLNVVMAFERDRWLCNTLIMSLLRQIGPLFGFGTTLAEIIYRQGGN